MKPFPFLTAAVAAFSMMASAVMATPTIKPQVDFSADMNLDVGAESITGRIFHSGGKDRREMKVQQYDMVMISSPEEVLMIVPAAGMAMRMESPEDPLGEFYEQAEDATFEAEGKEKVNGEDTTRYRVTGDGADGHVWLTDDGILVRADVKSDDGEMSLNVTNVKRGSQDAALFKAPSGMRVMDMGSMGGGMSFPGLGR
ncbi:MAG: DUF4412 domain-containing protein [Sphingomonadales bacterium]